MRERIIAAGAHTSGSIVWAGSAGPPQYSVGYEASLGENRGWLRLKYTKMVSGVDRRADYRVALTTTPQPFGGRRWWFVCPMTGRNAQKLYLPFGATVFASRTAYRLGYQSQRETPHDRAIQRAFKLRRKLSAEGGIGDAIWKPKWMRWRTFDRKMGKVEAAEAICNRILKASLDRLEARKMEGAGELASMSDRRTN